MRQSILISVLFLITVVDPAGAGDFIWNGGGTDNYLHTDANWTSGVAPDPNGLDDLFFQGTTRTTPTALVPWQMRSLTFVAGTPFYHVYGSELRVAFGGITNNSSSNQVFENPILLVANSEFRAYGPMKFKGPINLDNHVMYITDPTGLPSQQPVTLAGTVSLGFIEVGSSGDLELEGEILCDVDVLGGRLIVSTDTPQPAGSVLQFANGSSLEVTGTRATQVALQLDGVVTFGGGGDLSVSNAIRGSGALIVDGTGTLRLGSGYFMPFAGAVDVRSGMLDLTGAQPGVPLLTGPITIGNGSGPAGDAVLRLGADGAVETASWIPYVHRDARLELADGIALVEAEIEGGAFLSEGSFQAEIIVLTASDREAAITGGWNTPGANQVDVVQLADGTANPDLTMTLTRPGPGTLRIAGPGQARLQGGAVSGEGPLEVVDATLALARDAIPASALPTFSATDAVVLVEAAQQFGPSCELTLTRSMLDVPSGLDQTIESLILTDATVDGPFATLSVNGDIDVSGDSSLNLPVQMGQGSCCVQLADGSTLFLAHLNAPSLAFSGRGTIDVNVLEGSFSLNDGTMRSNGSIQDLSVGDSILEVPEGSPSHALEVSGVLSINDGSSILMTIRSSTEYSRIVNAGASGQLVLDGDLVIELAPDHQVQAGDEFVLVDVAEILGAANRISLPASPAPDLIWTLEVGPIGAPNQIILRAEPLAGADLSLHQGAAREPIAAPLGLDGVAGIEFRPLGVDDLRVMGVTIEGLQAIAPTNVGVRIYDSSSQSLIASSNLVLQPTTIPMTVTFPFDTLLQPFELVHLVLYAEDPMSVRLTRARAFSFPGSSVHEVVNAYRTIGQGDVIPQTPTDEIFEASLTLFDPSVTAVQDLPASGLRKVALRAAPNPFNPRTMVSFDLPTAGQIDIDMHDVRGRRVCSIASGFWPAGRHQMPFDGRDSRGRPLASGVYFLRLRAASSTVVKKVGLVK